MCVCVPRSLWYLSVSGWSQAQHKLINGVIQPAQATLTLCMRGVWCGVVCGGTLLWHKADSSVGWLWLFVYSELHARNQQRRLEGSDSFSTVL